MDTLKFFSKSIVFVGELNKIYGSKHPNIRLYYKLMKKTPIGNSKAIQRHNDLILQFLQANKESIQNGNFKSISSDSITFNNNIYLNIKDYINEADKDTRASILKHLQLLLYIAEPNDDLKEILKKTADSSNKPQESKFIENLIGKLEKTFSEQNLSEDDAKNPMNIAMNMVQSGMFNEIVQSMNDGVQSGELDPQNLLSSVQGVLGNLSGGSVDINNILNGGNINIPNENGDSLPIDMNQMFNMVGSMMQGFGGNQNSSSTMNNSSNPMNMVSTLLPMLTGGSSKPSIDELEEEMKNAKLD